MGLIRAPGLHKGAFWRGCLQDASKKEALLQLCNYLILSFSHFMPIFRPFYLLKTESLHALTPCLGLDVGCRGLLGQGEHSSRARQYPQGGHGGFLRKAGRDGL